MIPPRPSPRAQRGEKRIYNTLKRAPHSADWVVIHSKYLENPNSEVRPHQADFVILMPSLCTVICLEVKDVSYSKIEDGQWYRAGSDEPERVNPPEQAADAMWDLRREFRDTYFRKNSLIAVGCAVAFTRWKRDEGMELPRYLAQLIEIPESLNPVELSKFLMEYAEALQANNYSLRNNQVFERIQKDFDDLEKELNPTLKFTPTSELIYSANLDTLRPQLLDLTVEQLAALTEVSEHDRVAVDGAAGTGKTVLAMELASRLSESGQTVGLMCSNAVLSERFEMWARGVTESTAGTVATGTPASLPAFAFRNNPELLVRHQQRLTENPSLEESLKSAHAFSPFGWATFVKETIEDLGQDGIFDHLIVDEAQNLCDKEFLGLMNALLKGGLTHGKWAMFGDFKNQNIVNPRYSKDGRTALMELYGINFDNANLTVTLEQNCRNTHEVSAAISLWIKVPSLPMSGVHGPDVQVKYFKSDDDIETMLDETICELKQGRLQPSQIIMLSSGGDDFDASRPYCGWKLENIRQVKARSNSEEAISVSSDSASALRYSDVYDFQGLESDVVVLVLPLTGRQSLIGGTVTMPDNDLLRRTLYTGMSRAKMGLIVVAHEGYQDYLDLEPRFIKSYADRVEDLSVRTSSS